jgi:hypothetical protein
VYIQFFVDLDIKAGTAKNTVLDQKQHPVIFDSTNYIRFHH